MPQIPSKINGVKINFALTVNKNVGRKVIQALKLCVKPKIASGYLLKKIYISSANDSHKLPSRHVQGNGKGVDISRINGMKMGLYYKSNKTVKSITDSIQNCFELYPHRRENFGPLFKKKHGKPYNVSGHQDHIHISVN